MSLRKTNKYGIFSHLSVISLVARTPAPFVSQCQHFPYAIVSICLTPLPSFSAIFSILQTPPPLAADIICEQPLTAEPSHPKYLEWANVAAPELNWPHTHYFV